MAANSARPTDASVTRKAIFRPGKSYVLKPKIFRNVTTVLNERKHLKIALSSVPDSVILFLDRSDQPGLTALHRPFNFEFRQGHSWNARRMDCFMVVLVPGLHFHTHTFGTCKHWAGLHPWKKN
jgi:hypothetical protein